MAQEWSFVGLQHAQINGVDGDYSVNVPSGTQEGDLMLLFVADKDDTGYPTVTNPTAGTWTSRVSDTVLSGWYWVFKAWEKLATGSEPSTYTVNCSRPTGDQSGGVMILLVLRGIGVYDESTYDEETGQIHQGPALTVDNADSAMVQFSLNLSTDGSHGDDTGFWNEVTGALILDHMGLAAAGVAILNVGAGSQQLRIDSDSSITARNYAFAYRGIVAGEAALQGVATASLEGHLLAGGQAALQGVGTIDPQPSAIFGGQATLQGVSRLLAQADAVPFLDFTTYDAYIETPGGLFGLIFYDEAQPETVPVPLQPTRTDVGNNPDEIRPEFGNYFAQSDFSHGAGQRYFHQPGRDYKRFFYSEGFDITEPGRLRHLYALAEAYDSASIGALAQAGGLPFAAVGNRIRRGDGNFPGTWTEENPHVAEGDQTVEDLAAEGARLFAALGTNGVHVRSAAGTWSHLQPDGSTNLSVGTATRLAWLKERLIVVGGTASRSVYEVNPTGGSSTPTAIETLPEGWTFQGIFEAGGYIHVCAVNVDAGLSRVHHYGLNSSLSALEKKSSTPWPQGQLVYCGAGFPGLAFLGVAKRNSSEGYDPVLYRATIDANRGELEYTEIREEEGAGSSDLGVRAIAPLGESIITGWSLGSGAYGGARDGVAAYHVARQAFVHHLKKSGAGGSKRISAILPYKGRLLLSIQGDGLYYEDLSSLVTSAQLVTSAADWNNAGQKVWDLVEVSHDALPASTSIKVEYATRLQEGATWAEIFTSDVAGSEAMTGRVSNVKSQLFALRLTSVGTSSADPEFLGYSVRSLPSPATAEFQLTRFARLLSVDRRDEDGGLVLQDPRAVLLGLQQAMFSFVNFYEPGVSWIAYLKDASTVEPAQPFYDSSTGEALRDVFVVRLQMIGSR